MTHNTRIAALAIAPIAAAALVLAPAAAAKPAHHPTPRATVTAQVQTPTLVDSDEGGNASGDDPAIWVHPSDSKHSMVLATAKEGGLRVYDLAGRELQSLAATAMPNAGRYNNVDIAHDVRLGGRTVDLAIVSDRYNDTVRSFVIDPRGARAATPLREVTAPGAGWLFVDSTDELSDEHTAYGLAVWQPRSGGTFAIVTQEGTTNLAVVEMLPKANGTVGHRVVREFTMPASFPLSDGTTWTPCEEPGVGPQFEGLTVDQDADVLYAAQEDVGLWRIDLRGRKAPVLVDRTTDFGIHDAYDDQTEECSPLPGQPSVEENPHGGNITADAEGVDIYYGAGATGYVVLSSQGSDEFFVYNRQGRNALVGSFAIGASRGIDAVNGSDGLAISSRRVGQFTQGLLVSHDEPHTGAGVDTSEDTTNFHYVQWGDIARALQLKAPKQAKR